jgi:hypothetical protein
MKLRNYKKQPHWALHTYAGSIDVCTKNIFMGELTLHVAQAVNTEQLQHCML